MATFPGPKPTSEDLELLKELYFDRFAVQLNDAQALELGLSIVRHVWHSLYPVDPETSRSDQE